MRLVRRAALHSPALIGGVEMQYIAKFIGYLIDFLKIEFNLFGFKMSFWEIFIFVCLASIVFGAIGRIFSD